MRICIFGAGAIGGYLGVDLALAGADVSLIARGPHLEAMQKNGVKLLIDGEERVAHPTATDDPAEVGPQDVVIITLKAHSIPGIVETILPLLGPETAVITATNGLPWWYFHGLDGPWQDRQLESVDPGGKQWEMIGPERAIGCVVYPATEVIEPGVIKHLEGDRFSLGEPNGEKTERVGQLSEILRKAGFKAPIRPRIRNDIWVKLWGNLTFNPISALTGATLSEITAHPEARAVVRAAMEEADAVATALGVKIPVTIDRRIDGAEKVGDHKTSMLQDVEAGKPIELEGLVGAVVELGEKLDIPMPHTRTIYASAKLLAQGLAKGR